MGYLSRLGSGFISPGGSGFKDSQGMRLHGSEFSEKKAVSILWYFLPLLSIAGSTIFGDPKIRVRIDSNYLKCCPSLHFVQIEPLYLLKPSFISSKKNYLYGELYFGFLCWFKLRNKQKYWGLDTYLVWTTTLKNKKCHLTLQVWGEILINLIFDL